jgi:5-methylcytosine-specific restriction protein A
MPRSVKEWVARHDDQMPPQTVYDRLWDKQGGKDAITGIPFQPGDKIIRDHIVPLAENGENRESNLQLITEKTSKIKTAREAMERAEYRSVRGKHRGYDRDERPGFLTNRNGPLKRKMNGEIVRR